ncbi:MAG: hypothetical protein HOO67_00955 [Candidatus Peribacteraceae bacterium]|nr:hypothetical protein [Candidatus Peribacteraceae bacterium]
MAEVSDQLKRNISLAVPRSDDTTVKGKKIISFPFQDPLPFATRVLAKAFQTNANNIGTRLHNADGSEGGFEGSQELERRLLSMIAEILGAKSEEVDGFMTLGATASNLDGMQIGREKGRTPDKQCKNTTAIFGSFLTHYSIDRAAKTLNIAPNFDDTENDDGTGYYKLGTDGRGRVLVEQIEEKIERIAAEHPIVTHFIVVGNAGTTMLGSVDDIPQIDALITKLKARFPEKHFHFHVDAAFGAFVAPFLRDVPDIGFRNKNVGTVGVDIYKTLPGHVGSGALFVRRDLANVTRSSSEYVPIGGSISSVGSKPGAMAVACYAILRLLGKKGLQENAQRLMSIASFARDQLSELNLHLFPNDLPIIGVSGRFPVELLDYYIVHESTFPLNGRQPLREDSGFAHIWNVVAMPHIEKNILHLTADYRWVLHGRNSLWNID